MTGKRFFILAVIVLATSCIEPLELTPDIAGDILVFEVEGQVRSTVNTATRTVNIEVEQRVDLAAVRVKSIELVETATSGVAVGDVVDLSAPLKVTVTTVAEYEWTIAATKVFDSKRALPGGDFDWWSSTGTRPTWNPWPRGPESLTKPEDGEWEITRWWDTGNKGVNIIAPSNSVPTEAGEGCPANPGGRAAKLETKYVVLKVAGGNIFFGRFGQLKGLDATCEMGHPWSSKPKGLKGWYKYSPQPVDYVGNSKTNDARAQAYLKLHPYGLSFDDWMGSMDSLHVSVALWASPDGADIPFTVDTTPAEYKDLTRGSDGVIAWGSFISGDEQAEWAEFDLELEYLKAEYLGDTPLPANTYLVVQATASKHCNYFIAGTSGGGDDGKTGSLMYADEFELVY